MRPASVILTSAFSALLHVVTTFFQDRVGTPSHEFFGYEFALIQLLVAPSNLEQKRNRGHCMKVTNLHKSDQTSMMHQDTSQEAKEHCLEGKDTGKQLGIKYLLILIDDMLCFPMI